MTSSHTKNTYERSISTIRQAIAPESVGYQFLADHQAIITWIDGSKYAANSKKTLYIALVSTLKQLCLIDTTLVDAFTAYRVKMESLNAFIKENAEAQELTETEKAKYLPWPQVLECLEKIRLAVDDLWSFQQYLICALYCLTPPVRLDYAGMKVVVAKPEDTSCNYLVFNDKPYFIFNKYKTEKRYGPQVVPLPPALIDVIDEWLSLVDDEYLLITQAGLPMPEWMLGQTITEVFKKHSGKAVGVNVLRHSYISFQRQSEPALKTTQVLAQSMMHSTEMSQLYRRLS
jgi:integrase